MALNCVAKMSDMPESYGLTARQVDRLGVQAPPLRDARSIAVVADRRRGFLLHYLRVMKASTARRTPPTASASASPAPSISLGFLAFITEVSALVTAVTAR